MRSEVEDIWLLGGCSTPHYWVLNSAVLAIESVTGWTQVE